MGRSFFGFTLLICLLLGSLWLSHSADNQLLPLADQLEQAANAAMEADMVRSISLAQAAYRQWDQLWDPVASYANHTPMDEADQLFAQLSCWEDSPSRDCIDMVNKASAEFAATAAECKTVEEYEALITRFVSRIEAGDYRDIKQTAMNAFLDTQDSNFPIATLYRLWSIQMGYLAG